MQTYILSDFLKADLCVHSVKYLQRCTNPSWNRTPAFPRLENGLCLILSGALEYEIDGVRMQIHRGQVFKIPAGIPYSGRLIDDAPPEYYCIDF